MTGKIVAESFLVLAAITICAGVLWGYQERRIKELLKDKAALSFLNGILLEFLKDHIKLLEERNKKMANKITPPKGGSSSSNSGKNSGTTKPPKGNSNPTIRKGG